MLRKIRQILAGCAFNPKTDAGWKIVLDTHNESYYLIQAKIVLSNQVITVGDMIEVIRLMVCALYHRDADAAKKL